MDTICTLIPLAFVLFVLLIVWESRRISKKEEEKIRKEELEISKKRIKIDEENRRLWEEANRKIPFNLEVFQKEREQIEKYFSMLTAHISSLEERARKGDLVAYRDWKWELKKIHSLGINLQNVQSTTKDMTERELARHYLYLIEQKYRSEKLYLDCQWQE
jgi:hypothetical protein